MPKNSLGTIPTLQEFQKQSSRILSSFLNTKIRQLKIISPFLANVVKQNAPLLIHSGKRLRPYLCILGYASTGKKITPKIIQASQALELLHVFALIHDDLIDHSEQRRGFSTLHVSLSQTHKEKKFRGDSNRFGEAHAILVGDLLSSYTRDIFLQTLGESAATAHGIAFLEHIQQDVLAGQAEDVLLSANLEHVKEKDVIHMLRFKSGAYSVERPLQLGCLLGGGSPALFKKLSQFSIPLGIAFQIRDDVIGTFGDKDKVGKPLDSDIKEGKATLVAVHALRHASKAQKKKLLQTLGNDGASKKDVDTVRRIFQELGSGEYAKKAANAFLKQSLKKLEAISIPNAVKKSLSELAQFLVSRAN